MSTNKVHLKVKKSPNNWFEHYKFSHKDEKAGRPDDQEFTLQLCWDARYGKGFFLEQAAQWAGVPHFMEDFTKVLAYAEKNNMSVFSLYIKK